MKDNIKQLRKELHLSLAKFGKEIGYSAGAMGDIESGRSKVAPRLITLICDKFNVNEDWLRTGNGEMFKPEDPFNLNEIVGKYGLNDFERALFVEYIKLPADMRNGFLEVVQRAVESISDSPAQSVIYKVAPATIYDDGFEDLPLEERQRLVLEAMAQEEQAKKGVAISAV